MPKKAVPKKTILHPILPSIPMSATTSDIRAKILHVWKLVDERKISHPEARLQMGLARTVLETLKVEIAAAHLARVDVPPIPVRYPLIPTAKRQTQ